MRGRAHTGVIAVLRSAVMLLIAVPACGSDRCDMVEVTESLQLEVGSPEPVLYRVTGSLPVKDPALFVRPYGEHAGIVLRAVDVDAAALGVNCSSEDDRGRGHCSLTIPLESHESSSFILEGVLPGRYSLRGSLKRFYPTAEERLRHDDTECTTFTSVTVVDRPADAGTTDAAER